MVELYLSGDLVIPNGTIHLFADGGNGVIDPSLYPLVRPGDGVYFHVAMESGASRCAQVCLCGVMWKLGLHSRLSAGCSKPR